MTSEAWMVTLDHFGRFARPAQQILNVLAAGPRIPFSIRREVDSRCGVDLGPGTLFGSISRLERHALIEMVAAPAAPRAYRLTALGAETLEVQLATLASRPASSIAGSNLGATR
jgi:DNA-binding PadR family transcriptional regulator